MTIHHTTGLILGLTLSAAFGADEFLRDAVRSDTMMKDVAAQLDSLTHDMELSNVFTPADVTASRGAATEITATRNSDMKAVLRALELSLIQTAQTHQLLNSAATGHDKMAQTLSAVGKRLHRGDTADDSARDKLLALKKEVDALARDVPEGTKPNDEQQNRTDNIARELRSAEKEIGNENSARAMEKAAGKLEAGRPAEAARELQKAFEALDKDSKAGANASAADEARKSTLEKTAADLNAMAKEARALAANPNDRKAGDKALSLMEKAETAAKKLEENQAQSTAETVRQAETQLQDANYNEAAQKLATAADQANRDAKALDEKIKQDRQDQAEAMKAAVEAAAQLAELQALKDRIADAAKDQAEAMAHDGNTDPAQNNADKARRADQAGQLAKDLADANQKDAGENVDKAEDQIKNDQDDQASQSLKKAEISMNAAITKAQNKLSDILAKAMNAPAPANKEPPKGDPTAPNSAASSPKDESKERNFSTDTAKAGTGVGGDSGVWKSTLTKNERQALLSGQQEKSLPSMADDIKRYFQYLSE